MELIKLKKIVDSLLNVYPPTAEIKKISYLLGSGDFCWIFIDDFGMGFSDITDSNYNVFMSNAKEKSESRQFSFLEETYRGDELEDTELKDL